MFPNRRETIVGSAAATAALAIGPNGSVARAQSRRPNIMLVIADDWGWTSARAVDELGLRMPNLERLRRRGVSAPNAFAAAPSCTASRGSILTGRPIFQLEEGAQLAGLLPQKFQTYPDLLEAAGYAVGLVGKGWAPGALAPVGRTSNPAGPSFPSAAAFLAQRPAERPFCLWVGSDRPHRHFEPGSGARAGLAPQTVPPYLPDHPVVRADIADYMAAAEQFDAELGAALAAVEAAGELQNTLVVVTSDNGWPFPRGKATLYDAGTHVPFLAAWPGRLPEGATCDALISLTDLAATFLAAAGAPRPAEMTARDLLPVLQGRDPGPDFVITAMERHMNVHTVPLQGYPMRALRTRDHLLIRNFRPERWPAGDPPLTFDRARLETNYYGGFSDVDPGPAKAWLVLNREAPEVRRFADLALAKRPALELYDIRRDPYQLTNLATEGRHAAQARRLEARLLKELRRLADPRLSADPDVFDRYRAYNDPAWQRPAVYPF